MQPYRPHQPPLDPELARLARQGQENRRGLARAQQAHLAHAGVGHLKTAVGAYRGSTLKRSLLAGIVTTLVLGTLGVVFATAGFETFGALMFVGYGVAFPLFMIWIFVPPIGSQAALDAEHGWSTSLPFDVHGYFDVLAAEPQPGRSVVYALDWAAGSRPPDPALLHQIFGAVDPAARLEHVDGGGARIVGGSVSGFTGIRVNRRPVYRNHRFCSHVHAVVDQVLVPLHRSHPIARVSLSSG